MNQFNNIFNDTLHSPLEDQLQRVRRQYDAIQDEIEWCTDPIKTQQLETQLSELGERKWYLLGYLRVLHAYSAELPDLRRQFTNMAKDRAKNVGECEYRNSYAKGALDCFSMKTK